MSEENIKKEEFKVSGEDVLKRVKEIIKILKKNRELSIRQISLKVRSHRAVVLKSLEFLKRIGYARERKDDKNKVETRLFSLIKN